MCGIIGVLGQLDVTGRLVDGLKRLEYRGYDSAGVALLGQDGITRRRAPGKLANLIQRLSDDPITGRSGIGHTRWATHGAPGEANAHPHVTDRVAIVHNGIIENFRELKAELEAKGVRFESETDTEVVAHCLTGLLDDGLDPEQAMAALLPRLEGAFAFAVLFVGEPDLMIGARRGSPLAVGYGDGEMFLASDALALAPMTRRLSYLREGDWVVLTRAGARFRDTAGKPVERPIVLTEVSGALIGKGNHRHFMEKEIHEQPEVVGYTLHSYLDPVSRRIELPDLPFDPVKVPRLTIVACGTAHHAAMIAKYWIEQLAHLPVDVEIASEFRYREPVLAKGGAAIFISQSGETIDTLMALRYARDHGQSIVAVVNVPESTIAREADVQLRTFAGPEIGVASTKAFTCQLTVLACLALGLATARGTLSEADRSALVAGLSQLPHRLSAVLALESEIERLTASLAEARDVLYLGRGTSFPLALEGALKLKEISYIHAEGFAAGEMKHGSIALIDEHVPVVVIAPPDALVEKTISSVQEVLARHGKPLVITGEAALERFDGLDVGRLVLPPCNPLTAPIVYAVPIQLIAYHAAVIKGTDVDQPRNLAKSVTVE